MIPNLQVNSYLREFEPPSPLQKSTVCTNSVQIFLLFFLLFRWVQNAFQTILHWYRHFCKLHWSTKIDAVKVVWNISPDSTLLGVTDAWMKSHFSQSGQVFPQFWVFEAIFEARGKNLRIFKNSFCTFYCTQNDRLDPTVSMQKSVWKTDHPGPRYLQKCF